jgi:hypothetical protein
LPLFVSFSTLSFLLKKYFSILFLFYLTSNYGQVVERSKFLKNSGLTAYYVWEEDSLGYLHEKNLRLPFLQNYCILLNKAEVNNETPIASQLEKMILLFCHDNKQKFKRNKFKIAVNDSVSNNTDFSLKKYTSRQLESIIYIKKNNVWTSKRRKCVQYFTKLKDGKMRYIFSSDSIQLFSNSKNFKAKAHYTIYSFEDHDGVIRRQQIMNYAGEDVSSQFNTITLPIRTLVFANGYRGPKREKDQSDGMVTQRDRYHYWFKIDNQFIERLQPKVSFYIDGSFSIQTSAHKNKFKFALSYLRYQFSRKKAKSKRQYKLLNTKNNLEGFQLRRAQGAIAGEVFLLAKCYTPNCSEIKDTVDIVCHSMGYAYAIGFMEQIKDKVVFGKIYIVAPEGADNVGFDWSLFEEVWQYGTNLGEKNADPVVFQDGVAPQTKVCDLEICKKSARIFFPKDWPNKTFIESHMIYNYQWMFDRIKKGENGYIGK